MTIPPTILQLNILLLSPLFESLCTTQDTKGIFNIYYLNCELSMVTMIFHNNSSIIFCFCMDFWVNVFLSCSNEVLFFHSMKKKNSPMISIFVFFGVPFTVFEQLLGLIFVMAHCRFVCCLNPNCLKFQHLINIFCISFSLIFCLCNYSDF